jgi:hypothetical protein
LPSGNESEVFISKDNKSVIKFNRLPFITDSVAGVDVFIDRINSHNEVFENAKYEVLGFGKDSQGNTCVIMQ